MVAKFVDAKTAALLADELETFLATNFAERDPYSDEPTPSERELASKYGYEWSWPVYWEGDARGHLPRILLENEVMIIQYDFRDSLDCLFDFITHRGAKVETSDGLTVDVSVLFRAVRGANRQLDHELAGMYAQRQGEDDAFLSLRAPWNPEHPSSGRVAWFRDAGTAGFSVPIDPRDLGHLKTWLSIHGVDAIIRIDEPSDRYLFNGIAKARCTACHGPLEYLDPRLHDIETAQFACKPCGGL
jgi:hypothetical protein